MALRHHYDHGKKHGQNDYASQPRFGVPGEREKALIIKEVVSENSDAQTMPGKGASPGRDRQNPSYIPGMQHWRENETGAERPKHAAAPIAPQKKTKQRRHHQKAAVAAGTLRMPAWQNRALHDPA